MCRGQISAATVEITVCRGQISAATVEITVCRGQISAAMVKITVCRGQISAATVEITVCRRQTSAATVESIVCRGQTSDATVEIIVVITHGCTNELHAVFSQNCRSGTLSFPLLRTPLGVGVVNAGVGADVGSQTFVTTTVSVIFASLGTVCFFALYNDPLLSEQGGVFFLWNLGTLVLFLPERGPYIQ